MSELVSLAPGAACDVCGAGAPGFHEVGCDGTPADVDPAAALQDLLLGGLLDEACDDDVVVESVESFRNAGVLTFNKGLVVTVVDLATGTRSTLQVSIVQSA